MGLEYETVAISPDHRWLAAAASDTTVSIATSATIKRSGNWQETPASGSRFDFFRMARPWFGQCSTCSPIPAKTFAILLAEAGQIQ